MFKKIMKMVFMAGLVAITFSSVTALAEDDSFSISADAGVFSQYVWRGFALSDESIVIQPSVTFAYDGLSLNVWGNFDTDYYDTGADYNETDITLSYGWSYDIIDMGLGYIYYDLEGDNTQEVYFTATIESYLNPRLTFYRDIDAFEGWYVKLALSHSYPVTNQIALDLSASVGYYDLEDDTYHALHDANISASTTFAITDKLSMTPSLTYTWAVTSDSKAVIEDYKGNTDHFVGGFTCSYSF